jgi:hypothetical protein
LWFATTSAPPFGTFSTPNTRGLKKNSVVARVASKNADSALGSGPWSILVGGSARRKAGNCIGLRSYYALVALWEA